MAAKFDVVDYLPTRVVCGDESYLYAIVTSKLYRAVSKDTSMDVVYTHPDGYDIGLVWATSTPGLILMTATNLATSKTYLYKSVDYGSHFGNNASFDNNGYVALIGDVDGTVDNQIPLCSLLGRGFCELNGRLYFGEYNVASGRVSGSTNDQVRVCVSDDSGSTWQTAIVWNTDGETTNIRHVHSVQTDGQSIYICAGDLSAESGILKWDGLLGGYDNKNFSTYDDCLYGSQTYRTGDILFPPGNEYMFWMADSASPDETRGIYKAKRDMSEPAIRVNSDIIQNALHSGWYGVVVDAHTMIFSEFLETGNTNYEMYFYSTSDGGETWDTVARYGSANVNSGCRAFFKWKDDNLYYERVGAGKDYLCTSVFKKIADRYDDEWPVVLHPVYWVSSSGIDGTGGAGYRPSTPWKTPKYALTADKITNGARVIIGRGDYTVGVSQIALKYNANYRPGDVNALTVIEGQGVDNTRIDNTLSTGVFYIVKDNTPILIKDLSGAEYFESLSGAVVTIVAHAAPKKGPVYLRSCNLGQEDIAANVVINNYQDVDIANTTILGNTGTDGIRSRANSRTIVRSAIIDKTKQALYCSDPGAYIDLDHVTISRYTYAGINIAAGSTLVPKIKNCAFIPGVGAIADHIDWAGLTETDDEINYNYYGGILTNITNNGGTHSIHGGNPKFYGADSSDFHLESDSPLRSTGTQTDVEHDYSGEPYSETPSIGAYEYNVIRWGQKNKFDGAMPEFDFPAESPGYLKEIKYR